MKEPVKRKKAVRPPRIAQYLSVLCGKNGVSSLRFRVSSKKILFNLRSHSVSKFSIYKFQLAIYN